MVGNDIVDHESARKLSRWESARFKNKIFTPYELQFLNNDKNDFEMIWRLWSMKESTYKVYVQQTGLTFRNPHHIIVNFIGGKHGVVTIGNFKYHTSTISNTDYTHTVAFDNEKDQFQTHIFQIPAVELTQYSHQKLLQNFAKANHCNVNELQLKKNKVGVPFIYQKGIQLYNSVSISHHHNYGAVSFQ